MDWLISQIELFNCSHLILSGCAARKKSEKQKNPKNQFFKLQYEEYND